MRLESIKINIQEELSMLIDMINFEEDRYTYNISKELPGFKINGKTYDLHIDIDLR